MDSWAHSNAYRRTPPVAHIALIKADLDKTRISPSPIAVFPVTMGQKDCQCTIVGLDETARLSHTLRPFIESHHRGIAMHYDMISYKCNAM